MCPKYAKEQRKKLKTLPKEVTEGFTDKGTLSWV